MALSPGSRVLLFATSVFIGCTGPSPTTPTDRAPPDASSATPSALPSTTPPTSQAPAKFDLSITFHPDVSGKLGWVKLPEPVPLWMLGDKGAKRIELDAKAAADYPEIQDLLLARTTFEDTGIELDEASLCGEALRVAVTKAKPKRMLLSFVGSLTKTGVGCLRSLASPRLYLTGCLYRAHRPKEGCDGDAELAELAADDSVRARVFGVALSIARPESLASLARFPVLEALALEPGARAEDVRLFESLPFDELPHVRWIYAGGNNATADLWSEPASRFVSHLESLDGNIELSTPIPAPCSLSRVGLGHIEAKTIDSLRACPIRELSSDSVRLESVSALVGFGSLEVLHLMHLDAKDLSPLALLRSLRVLDIPGTNAKEFNFLAKMTGLERLDLSFAEISSLDPIGGLVNLRALDLSFAPNVTDLSPIEGLHALQELDVVETKVDSIAVVRGMRALEDLSFAKTAVSDLEPLTDLPELAVVMLYATKVRDASALLTLPKLKRANVSLLMIPEAQTNALKKKLGSELYD
jgi:Leucine-rich repeat (LRR) protein